MKFEVITSYGCVLEIERFPRITKFRQRIFMQFYCFN